MKTSILLITISGTDRPGIVHEIAATVHRHKGNWERSRLIHLSARFVGLLQVSVNEEEREALRKDLLNISDLELTVADGSGDSKPSGSEFSVNLIGADHPGIVSEIFGAAAGLGLNVESMSTSTEAAADSGTLLFRAKARFSSEKAVSQDQIREHLERIAHDLLVEVSVDESE